MIGLAALAVVRTSRAGIADNVTTERSSLRVACDDVQRDAARADTDCVQVGNGSCQVGVVAWDISRAGKLREAARGKERDARKARKPESGAREPEIEVVVLIRRAYLDGDGRWQRRLGNGDKAKEVERPGRDVVFIG